MTRFLGLCLRVLTGGSTPASRIEDNRAAFDRYPAAIQAKIRAGEVAPGFTPEMVRLALGEPLRRLTRTEAEGEVETWIYGEDKPRLSFGLGLGGGGGHTAVGAVWPCPPEGRGGRRSSALNSAAGWSAPSRRFTGSRLARRR